MKSKILRIGTLTATFALLALLLSACAWSVGGEGRANQPTRGQELIDLKRAKAEGAISEDEYQAQKRRVLER
jgi:hypothetical protein